MAYALERSDPDMAAAVRRIASEEIAGALARLAEPDLSEAKRIHGLRKHVKRLRGLIRLVRPNFPGYKAENAAFRDAARGISGLRDAEVLRGTLETLADGAPEGAQTAIDHLRAALARDQARVQEKAGDDGLADFAQAMREAQDRVADWDLQGNGFDLLEDGLSDTWKAARKLQRKARRDADAEQIHEWRKKVKDHWYQATILSPIWPEMMAPHVDAADHLGEWLGDHHDLAVFIDRLAVDEGLDADDRARLEALAAKRQKKLERKAGHLATRLFAEDEAALVGRWRVWWQQWQRD